MLFFVNPQSYVDPEDAYVEYKRREYVAALQEQQRRTQFQRELELEEQRHRLALASIAQQEATRQQQHQQQRQRQCQQPRQSVPMFTFQQPSRQNPFEAAQQEGGCAGRRYCRQPMPEEILKRRQARQAEEESQARAFHEHILSQIFGVGVDQSEDKRASTASVSRFALSNMGCVLTVDQQQDKGKGRATDAAAGTKPAPAKAEADAQPHWSAAPERARSLAEITSITRTFASLRNTFVFPSGPLERLAGSQDDAPRLAYNAVNATIHAYDHALAELLTRLDGVESHGFKGVREARKQLIVKIEAELERVEKLVAERLTGAVSPVNPSSNATNLPVETEQVEDNQVVEKQVVVEDIEMDAVTTSDKIAGYDLEPEEVAHPAPTTEVTESPRDKQVEDNSMVVEPTAAAAATTPDMDIPAHVSTPVETTTSHVTAPKSTLELHLTESQPLPTEPTHEPAHTFPPTTILDVSHSSDEESEVEDAIHVEVSSEDELVDSDHDAFEML